MHENYLELSKYMEKSKRDEYLDLIARAMAELAKTGARPSYFITQQVQEFLNICVINNIKIELRYEP